MFKDVLNHADLEIFAEVGLLIFVVVFVGVTIWAFTRSRAQVRDWSEIPLSEKPEVRS